MAPVSDVFLTTRRLVLRRFTGADLDDMHELDSDPEVMRFLTNGRATPREVMRDVILAGLVAEYDRSGGTGQWAALRRDTGAFIGWFGLRRAPDRDPGDLELGYRLRRAVWGSGLATEGSRALVEAAFTRFGADRVWAQTMAVNHRSRRVMEKAGLTYVRTVHLHFDDPIPGTEHGEVEYALTAAEWRARPASGSPQGVDLHGRQCEQNEHERAGDHDAPPPGAHIMRGHAQTDGCGYQGGRHEEHEQEARTIRPELHRDQ
jgi:RimJ/RimL family protein N-acetyltransferase